MNKSIRNGLGYAVPCLIAIPFIWLMCGVGYIVKMQIDPQATNGIFFYYWAIAFSILFLAMALIGFAIGIMEKEYGQKHCSFYSGG